MIAEWASANPESNVACGADAEVAVPLAPLEGLGSSSVR